MTDVTRSFVKIEQDDLRRLAGIARRDRELLFRTYPALRQKFVDGMICTALCQGAALHYIDGKTGVKDFDVWTFYRASERGPYPAQRRGIADFGNAKFGQSLDRPKFTGRRVDLMGRSIACLVDDPVECLREYFRKAPTLSAALLSKKAAIILEPIKLQGFVAWPEDIPF